MCTKPLQNLPFDEYNGGENSSRSINEIPVSLWSEVHRIFSIQPDWCQITLNELHDFGFVTVVSEICPAYVDSGGEIYFVNQLVFRFILRDGMCGDHLTEVIKNHSCYKFLMDCGRFSGMPVNETDCVFQFPETGFFCPPQPV